LGIDSGKNFFLEKIKKSDFIKTNDYSSQKNLKKIKFLAAIILLYIIPLRKNGFCQTPEE